jgi:hypothetical protein
MPEERLHGETRHRPEQYEETVAPRNPPVSTGAAAPIVAGMWYYLAPLTIIVLALVLALFYWSRNDNPVEEPTAPTTGAADEVRPGGHNPDPKPSSTEEELKNRGER